MSIVQDAMKKEKVALAKLISWAENETPEAADALREIYPRTGGAHVIGITGPPGSGKSTLTDKLVKALRKQDKLVGVIAVDPTSPFTGGAILGDRIRMSDLSLDPGVFIRSMGTRGSLGGLSVATHDAVKILDAAGYEYIFIETVGVGQSEVDIIKTADSVIVVSVPGLGDDVQASKAGIMEIGDIFVVNKADSNGAQKVVIELNQMLDLNPNTEAGYRPSVLKTIAATGEGVAELVGEIESHWAHLQETGKLQARRRDRLNTEILENIMRKVSLKISSDLESGSYYDKQLDDVVARKTTPYDIRDNVIDKFVFSKD